MKTRRHIYYVIITDTKPGYMCFRTFRDSYARFIMDGDWVEA